MPEMPAPITRTSKELLGVLLVFGVIVVDDKDMLRFAIESEKSVYGAECFAKMSHLATHPAADIFQLLCFG